MEVIKWLKIVNDFRDNKDSFECPYCKSKNIGIQAKKVFDVGYMVIWCNDCKKGIYISRMLNPIREQNDKIPDDIQWR